ncbi:hypothetical protein [Pedobacter psychrophilus]|uniref:hypothetical protein n=1 Tax=Pedobacter psychrophilus TaxID=1826909 RepID=UPI0012FD1B27|nr:hypothetical protein [Pedobacter psychrophilus]
MTSCNLREEKSNNLKESVNEKVHDFKLDSDATKTYILPDGNRTIEIKSPERYYRFLPESQIEVTIEKTYLNSYVTKENPSGAFSEYLDTQFRVFIKQESQTVLDTILVKQDFSKYIDKDKINNLVLNEYSYSYGEFPDKIEFQLSFEPDDGPSQNRFIHVFDLKDRTMKLYMKNGSILVNIPENRMK